MYNQNYNSNSVPRNMIVFLQIFGTIFAAIGLITYISFMNQISNSIGAGDASSKAITSLLLAIITYLAWKTIYTAVVIVRFVKNSSDDDISANRFIISALSLNLGGFVTPFIITMLPNVATRSTINSRWFLTKAMGVTSLVGGIISLLAFFVSALTGQNGGLTSSQLFDITQTAGIISVVVLTLGLTITLFGIISVTLFYQSSSHETFEANNTKLAKVMNTVAVVWLAILTIELLLTMFFAIVRLLGALGDLMRAMRSEGFGKLLFVLLALTNLVLTFVFVGYTLYLTSRAMVGIWSKDGIEYKPYQSLINLQQRQRQQDNYNFA